MVFQPLDYALIVGFGFLVVVGLYKGLSGCLGSLAGTAAAACGVWGFGLCRMAVVGFSCVSPALRGPAAVGLNLLAALMTFWLVRKLTIKFVNLLVPQPFDALLGAVGGALLSAVIAWVLATSAMFEGCTPEEGFMARHSNVVMAVVGVMRSGLQGMPR